MSAEADGICARGHSEPTRARKKAASFGAALRCCVESVVAHPGPQNVRFHAPRRWPRGRPGQWRRRTPFKSSRPLFCLNSVEPKFVGLNRISTADCRGQDMCDGRAQASGPHESVVLISCTVYTTDRDQFGHPPHCLAISQSSQVTSLYINNREQTTNRMCSGSQLWWKGVGGDDGRDPSRGDLT